MEETLSSTKKCNKDLRHEPVEEADFEYLLSIYSLSLSAYTQFSS
jgi:hypothetical protein